LAVMIGVSVLLGSVGGLVYLVMEYVAFRPSLDRCEELLADAGLGRVVVDDVWVEDGLIHVSVGGSIVVVSMEGRVVGCVDGGI